MRKWITLLMTLLVGCVSYANANTGQVCFEAGYRRDTIDWRTRFPSDDPFLKSSRRFKDLDIFQIGVHGRSTLSNNFYVRGCAYWGWILDGDFKRSSEVDFDVSDFSDDNLRFGVTDHNRSTIDDQYVFGINGAIGYPFYFCDCTMILAPVIGYGFDEQNVRVDDSGFNFDFADSYNDDFNGEGCCRRTFISRWYGPFVGVDFDWRPWNSCFNLWAEVEFHWGNFRGKTSHHFNDDGFFGFDNRNRHSNEAKAWVFAGGIDYDLCNCWTVGLSFKVQDWSANRHHRFCDRELDLSYDFGQMCDHRFRDNNKWRSYAINLTFGRDF